MYIYTHIYIYIHYIYIYTYIYKFTPNISMSPPSSYIITVYRSICLERSNARAKGKSLSLAARIESEYSTPFPSSWATALSCGVGLAES